MLGWLSVPAATHDASLPYTFDAVGWEDFDGDRHEGTPSDLENTHGVLVHVTNTDDTDDVTFFWAYGAEFEDWAEWWVYIGSLMEMYGLSLGE